MVEIIVNNNKSQLLCDAKILFKIRNLMKIKAKNYFWSPAWRERKWDGYINYITENTGYFETGLLDQVCNHLRSLDLKFEITDRRLKFRDLNEVTELGDLILRDDQRIALHTLLNHKVEGIKFIRGIMAEATNYGKSLIIAGTFASFSQKRKGLVLLSSKVLFTQVVSDLQKLLGKEQVGWVSSDKGVKWNRVNVCMVQTLANRIKSNMAIRNALSQQDIVLIDEYDLLIGRKDCKYIMAQCYNASIRVGFTGSELMSKDKNRNMDQLKFCGPIIHKTSNKELVDSGVSSKPNISFYLGNTKADFKGDYNKEYEKGIIKNKARNRKIWRIASKKILKGPVLILFKIHKHGYNLLATCQPEFMEHYNIKLIHHKTLNRQGIIDDYNNGKIDVLIASMIIRRGLNLPFIRTLINAAGGDSEESIIQILGRGLRKKITKGRKKDKIDMVEFYDRGSYLQKHSKHRIRYYKKQQFPVKELYKEKLKNY